MKTIMQNKVGGLLTRPYVFVVRPESFRQNQRRGVLYLSFRSIGAINFAVLEFVRRAGGKPSN
jgi:hypothetical protein